MAAISLPKPRLRGWSHLVAAVCFPVLGLALVAVADGLLRTLGAGTFALVLIGGLVYSLGAVVFARHRPDPVPAVFGYHEVFHALVLLAGACFYVAVARTVA